MVFMMTCYGEVEVSLIHYNGWPDSIQIENAETVLIVVPAIGRIMHYQIKNHKNVLWQDRLLDGQLIPEEGTSYDDGPPKWFNFGGDKVWPTEQSEFPKINGFAWPPDYYFDGSRHQFEILPDGVRMTSPVSRFCGARVIRTIRLDAAGSGVRIEQSLEKVSLVHSKDVEPIEFTIWSVTQVQNPKRILVPINPKSQFAAGYYTFPNRYKVSDNFSTGDGVGSFIPSRKFPQKIGVDSGNWLAAVWDDQVFAQFFKMDDKGRYPDGGLPVEVYTSPRYTELELLSPLKSLKPGESIHYSIRWELKSIEEFGNETEHFLLLIDWLNSAPGF
jgi:hypothetical protein